jgi:hypothetical protein
VDVDAGEDAACLHDAIHLAHCRMFRGAAVQIGPRPDAVVIGLVRLAFERYLSSPAR